MHIYLRYNDSEPTDVNVEISGIGVDEATRIIRSLSGNNPSSSTTTSNDFHGPLNLNQTEVVINEVARHLNKLVAIILVRSLAGLGLLEAKRFVDNLEANGTQFI